MISHTPNLPPSSLLHLSPVPDGSPLAAALGSTSAQVLRVMSEDVAPGHLRAGDYIVVQPRTPEYGDMVLATLDIGDDDDTPATVMGRLKEQKTGSLSRAHVSLVLDDLRPGRVVYLGDLTVHGVVVGVIRRY